MNEKKYNLSEIRDKYLDFINQCRISDDEFSFTKNTEMSPFALCFAIFGINLLNERKLIEENKFKWAMTIKENLDKEKYICSKKSQSLVNSKSYLQLLSFSLSALNITGLLETIDLRENVLFLKKFKMHDLLINIGALRGVPGSGNFAMFYYIVFYYLKNFLNLEVDNELSEWIRLHSQNINKHGFWGKNKNISHLQFQNGYHQYEIFNFLKIKKNYFNRAADNVLELSDNFGHFAPYIGGGSCYDYDAIYLIFNSNRRDESAQIIGKTYNSILSAQNQDGGFAESKKIRPLNINYFIEFLSHIKNSSGAVRRERIRQFLTLMRFKHNKIETHWSKIPRGWNESNLWDSWFRMMTISLIDIIKNRNNKKNWGFINFPGIGFNHND